MLKCLSQKGRKLQRYVWSRLGKNLTKSSKVHRLIAPGSKSRHKTSVRLVQKMRRKPIFRTRKVNSAMRYVNKSNTAKHGKKYFKYLRLFSCNFPYNEDKSLTHRGNCTKYKLCNDVEENPGPAMHHVDPNKTIKEPYKKGDVVVFGQNAGQKCVAMSLCALIYHNMKGISNPGDLKQIVHIGNQL